MELVDGGDSNDSDMASVRPMKIDPVDEMIMEHSGFTFHLNKVNIYMGDEQYGFYHSGTHKYNILRDSVYGQVVRMKLVQYYVQ